MKHMLKSTFKNESGLAPLLLIVVAVAVLSFFVFSMYAPFKDQFLSSLFPKDSSHAMANPAVTQTVQMVEQSSIPQVQNVKVWADDRVATVSWDRPSNMSGIVGYIVQYGKTSDGPPTLNKQTIHTVTQIQPLENGVEYTVWVRAVRGRTVQRAGIGVPEQSTFAVADGPVSPAVVAKATPTSARVDAMRSRLTGFFDDFNTTAGPFDELKWNHATTGCEKPGSGGQFINGQFHAHNMTASTCDRDGNVSRPRAIFDIAGRTESNPGQIEMDVDGIGQPRDVWYIDLIPTTARKNGMPVDVTAHNSNGDDDTEDPGNMIRINQGWDSITIAYYDANRNPQHLNITTNSMPCGAGYGTTLVPVNNCNFNLKTPGFSPLSQPTFGSNREHPWVANVRRHWVIQFSRDRIKLFIDGTLIADAATPDAIKNDTKYVVHSTLFSYNTGKQFDTVQPTVSMLHWDNFGFTGPASTLVTHNYLDGGPDGSYPLIGTGMPGREVPNDQRETKINIPDQIGTPVGQPRLMFTLQPLCCRGDYVWNSSHNVVVNGKTYPFPNPALNFGTSVPPVVAGSFIAHSSGLYINPADLRTGMNDIDFNIPSGIFNVHLELDYNKTSAPSYTQPKDIFGFALLTSIINPPVMHPNDDYWFVEQWMGIGTPAGHSSPAPTTSPLLTSTPTPLSSASPVASIKPGDANRDAKVDIFDYSQILTDFGKTGTVLFGDVDFDGDVDIFDYTRVLTNFNK